MSRICQSKENLKKWQKPKKKRNKKTTTKILEDGDGMQMPCKLIFTRVKKCIDILQRHLK